MIVVLDLLLICSGASAYYNTENYGEYRFTIRGNAGNQAQWTTQTGAQQWCRNNLNGSSLASITNIGLQTNTEMFVNDSISVNYLSANNTTLDAQLQLTDCQWLNAQHLTSKTTFTITLRLSAVSRRSEDYYLLFT